MREPFFPGLVTRRGGRPQVCRQPRRPIPLIAALCALLSACEEREEARPVFSRDDARVELGLGGAHHPEGWNTLFLSLKNRGATFDGTIEVVGYGTMLPVDPVRYETHIEVPRGEARRLAVPVRARDWHRVTVRYAQGTFEEVHEFELPATTTVKTRVLVVGNRLPQFSALGRAIEACWHEPPQNLPLNVAGTRCEVTRLDPRGMTAHWAAYHPFQLIFVYNATLVGAPPGAVRALAAWVARGGSLVVFAGPESASGLPPGLSELSNVRPGAPPGPTPERIRRALGPRQLEGYSREWLPNQGTVASASGLSLTARHGAGTVTTFNFTPAGSSFPGVDQAPGLYTELYPAIVRALSAAGNPGDALAGIEDVIATSLFDMSSFQTPAGVVVAIGLALYLVGGFFVPNYFFKRRRRRELTFLVGTAAAVVASGAVYRFGALNLGDRTEMTEISVMRLHPDGRGAEISSFLGLLAPRRSSFALLPERSGPEPLGAFSGAAAPLRSSLGYRNRTERLRMLPTAVQFDRRGRPHLDRIDLRPNAIRCFRVDDRISAQNIVDVRHESTAESKVTRVLVRNRSEQPLFALVIDRWEVVPLGWVSPGETIACLPLPDGVAKARLTALRLDWTHHALPFLGTEGRRTTRPEWTNDPRRYVVKTVIRALTRQARGLAPVGYGAGSGRRAPSAPNQGLIHALEQYEPRTLLLVGATPVFRSGETPPERRALTCVVLELPSRKDST